MSSSRRKTPRFRVKIKAVVEAVESDKEAMLMFVTENMSTTGALVRSADGQKDALKVGLKLSARVFLSESEAPDETVAFVATIVHRTPDNLYGLHISGIDDKNQILLNKFINKIARDHPEMLIF